MKIRALLLASVMMLSMTACSAVNGAEVTPSQSVEQEQADRSLEELQKECPEYFELSAFKGIEVYVWQMAEDSYRCGMMSGTNRNKTDEEIWDLANHSLSIEEAKTILASLNADSEYLIVIPVIQPVSSYQYEIDDKYCETVKDLFKDSAVKGVI
ncbi:MAG: hypothetical protein J6X33_03670 [Clostridiales bacterium]|nr:hypothetical protein [Clostridiales bacterium]